jgi:hypothetical protein
MQAWCSDPNHPTVKEPRQMTNEKDPSRTTKDVPTVEVSRYLKALRQAVGRQIDPETAEVDWIYAQTLDPYGDDPDQDFNKYHLWPMARTIPRWGPSVSKIIRKLRLGLGTSWPGAGLLALRQTLRLPLVSNLRLATLVLPDRQWRIVTSQRHSTVWYGDDTLFDFNGQALFKNTDEAFEHVSVQQLKPGRYMTTCFAEHYQIETERHRRGVGEGVPDAAKSVSCLPAVLNMLPMNY